MLRRLLSNDPPRSRTLTGLLLACVLGPAVAPLLWAGGPALDAAAQALVLTVLAVGVDLLWGYQRVPSFLPGVGFGLGALGVAWAGQHAGAGWGALALGGAAGLLASALLAGVAGAWVGTCRRVVQAAVTLAIALAFQALLTWAVPALPGFAMRAAAHPMTVYMLLFAAALASVPVLLRIVHSPFGRTLDAIRDNPLLAEAIGFRTVLYRVLLQVFAAGFGGLAGVLAALWAQGSGRVATASFETLLCALLAVWIGGRGTAYGAVLGSVLLVLGQQLLQALLALASAAAQGLPWLALLVSPDRWLPWLALLCLGWAYHAPAGLVGLLRADRRPSTPSQDPRGDPP